MQIVGAAESAADLAHEVDDLRGRLPRALIKRHGERERMGALLKREKNQKDCK